MFEFCDQQAADIMVFRAIPERAALEVLADLVECVPNSLIPTSISRDFIHLETVVGETAFRVKGEISNLISFSLNDCVALRYAAKHRTGHIFGLSSKVS